MDGSVHVKNRHILLDIHAMVFMTYFVRIIIVMHNAQENYVCKYCNEQISQYHLFS